MSVFKRIKKKVVKPAGSKKPFGRSMVNVLNGDFLTREGFVEYLPYILFCTALTLVYIANGYYAEGSVRDINRTGNELKELRSEYITTTSDLMFQSKQSEVIKILNSKEVGLEETVTPPKKIVIVN